jgi:hypothetical protein
VLAIDIALPHLAGTVAPGPAEVNAVREAPDGDGDSAVLVPIESLQPADSPRLNGLDEAHAMLLAESDDPLPPILVQRGTLRVIDGMHRLRAAQLQGKTHVPVYFFDGDDHAVFLRSVTSNIAHGLPLSLADREGAAIRLMSCYPHWSDRGIAKACGLSGKTVGALRRRAVAELPQLNVRVGQDGRARPLNAAAGRRLVSQFIAAHPDASLREVARVAGVSPATVRDVRERMRRGDSPVTASQERAAGAGEGGATTEPRPPRPLHRVRSRSGAEPEVVDSRSIMDNLRRDPSLRYTDSGRALLRWLDKHLVDSGECGDLVASVPPHCLPVVARLAQHVAAEWQVLADRLDKRMREIA